MFKKYNIRNQGRYKIPGNFVSENSGEGTGQPGKQDQQGHSNSLEATQSYVPEESIAAQPAQPNLQDAVQEMKKEEEEEDFNTSTSNVDSRPPWMKSKLAGVKKITNKERRRRQNETLRRLLTPKNALMVLNEMLPKDQLSSNFKVETMLSPNPYAKPPSYLAKLTVEDKDYKGFGDNKLTARNEAAEQAVRDLIIKKMTKAIMCVAAGGMTVPGEEEEEPLPMIQLASYALHKLFCEWELEGHKVPQLMPLPAPSSPTESELSLEAEAVARSSRGTRKPKTLPADASSMHPCMLLTYMRPALEYRELPALGDRPQNMIYTFALHVDGATYIGKASNKKEARRAAAQEACKTLFGVEFNSAVSYTS